jgi:hypothetical protein
MRSVLPSTVAAVLASVLCAGFAHGQQPVPLTKQQCIDADADAQSLRMAGQLREARERLSTCASAECPQMVRDDCNQRMDEVQRATPTIVFSAKDASGQDVVDVKVTVDGQPFADRLDGTALAANPGPHKYVFHFATGADVERSLVLREGEKDRRETIVAAPAAATAVPVVPPEGSAVPATPSPSTPVGSPATEQPAPAGMSKRRLVGWVVGGVGVAGVLVGGVAGLLSFTSWNASKNDCTASTVGKCPNHAQAVLDHDTAVSDATVSTVAFGVGLAALAAGAVILFTAPAEPAATSLQVTPLVGPASGGLLVRGAF